MSFGTPLHISWNTVPYKLEHHSR